MIEVHQFPCLQDNYGFLVHDESSGETATIDTPEPARILQEAEKRGWRITQIWNTHHHADHAGGNLDLKEKTGARITGPAAEATRIPGIDLAVKEGDFATLGTASARILDVPGHTAGHIAYVFEDERRAFVGDTMFAMGCGRLFEGTAETMWNSLSKLMRLAPDTMIYCAHEYTAANARFALTMEPKNAALVSRARDVAQKRERGEPTVPTRLDLELATNPFLRASSVELQRSVGMTGAALDQIFGRARKMKDEFKG